MGGKNGSGRGSIQGRLITEIRRRIIAGEIPPGVNISELALAEEFGVSRTPVRETFKQLHTEGLIEIRQSATGTDSYLGEFSMLLAKRARSVAIPSLEIDQPNVRRAAHSSSVGPIDEAQIFYLESRGIPPDEARSRGDSRTIQRTLAASGRCSGLPAPRQSNRHRACGIGTSRACLSRRRATPLWQSGHPRRYVRFRRFYRRS